MAEQARRAEAGPDMPQRRRCCIAGLAVLAGCGGGAGEGGADGPPAIQTLALEGGGEALVGEPARLLPRFSGGQGRIEPDIGPVRSGEAVATPVLAGARRYTLVVEAAGQPAARRELLLQPRYRDRYVALAPGLRLQYHTATLAGDGSVIVIGGSRGERSMSDAVDRYDPATRSFSRIGTLSAGRAYHSATRLADGRILALGGISSLAAGPQAELVDERSAAVSDAGRLAQPRSRHAAVALADGRVLVVGGLGRDSVELWDPERRQFRLVEARMAHRREYASATLLADGRVLIAGGYHDVLQPQFAEIFDPRSERFSPVPGEVPVAGRYMHEAQRLADGRVLIVGGETFDAQGDILPLDAVLVYEPAAGRLRALPGLEQARTLVRSVLTADEGLLLFGGQTAQDVSSMTSASYRAAADNGGHAIAPMPLGRSWHTVSRLADGRVLILGGDDRNGEPVMPAYLYE